MCPRASHSTSQSPCYASFQGIECLQGIRHPQGIRWPQGIRCPQGIKCPWTSGASRASRASRASGAFRASDVSGHQVPPCSLPACFTPYSHPKKGFVFTRRRITRRTTRSSLRASVRYATRLKSTVFAEAHLHFCAQISASLLKGWLRYPPDKQTNK